MAQPFDLKRLALGGEPVPVAQAVRSNEQGAGVFSVSDDGTLLFATGSLSGRAELAWFDRNGRQLETPVNRADWRALDLSSDGRRIVAHRHEGTTRW